MAQRFAKTPSLDRASPSRGRAHGHAQPGAESCVFPEHWFRDHGARTPRSHRVVPRRDPEKLVIDLVDKETRFKAFIESGDTLKAMALARKVRGALRSRGAEVPAWAG